MYRFFWRSRAGEAVFFASALPSVWLHTLFLKAALRREGAKRRTGRVNVLRFLVGIS
jgi:hypothetical protein